MTDGVLAVRRHDAAGTLVLKDELLAVYRQTYAERLDEPFFHVDRFWQRLRAYASRSGFRLVTGEVDGELVGFTLGGALGSDTTWWRGLRADVGSGFLTETGHRTFGINELQVQPAWRRRGYARKLTSALLADLAVERVTLLVRAENIAAYTAYTSWGFQTVGQIRPFEDSPVYEAMVRDLRPLS